MAARLPKWQISRPACQNGSPQQILCQTTLPNWQKDFFAFGMKLYFGFYA
jgi:hypothetical protein